MGVFSTLFKSYNQVYAEGSPLIICARALVKNNENGSLFAQLKFRNISSKTIKVVKVSVKALDSFGNETETIEGYQYLDFSAKRNAEFGNKQLIPIKDRNSRSFVAKCTEVLFEDGTSVSAPEEAEWTEISEQKKLETVFGAALSGQYRRDTFAKAEFVPDYEKDIWRCACGGINKNFENRCNICHNEKDFQYLALDRETLEMNFEEFRKEEAEKAEKARIERERKAEEARIAEEKRKKKNKKIAAIVTPIAVVIVAAIVIFVTVIQPNLEYNSAVALMEEGKYEEAITAFEAMEGYKDSAMRIENCEEEIRERDYNLAVGFMEEGDYSRAAANFKKLGDYKDSKRKSEECYYIYAGELMTEGKYDNAKNVLSAISSYGDSKALIDECNYLIAEDLLESKDYSGAQKQFENLNDYKDSREKVLVCKAKIIKEAKVGDTVFFGIYEQDNNDSKKEPIEWIVLDKKGDKVFLISRYIIDRQTFTYKTNNPTWETSYVREWLNNDFINIAFDSYEQSVISETTLDNKEKNNNSGRKTTDRIFVLNKTEAEAFFTISTFLKCKGDEYTQANGGTKYNDGYEWWVLRTIHSSGKFVVSVTPDGYTSGASLLDETVGVRPAMWIDLSAIL